MRLTRRKVLAGAVASVACANGCAAPGHSPRSYLSAFAPRTRDVAFVWTDIALQAVRDQTVAPPLTARGLAMGHVAGFSAINGIERRHAPYAGIPTAPAGIDASAAYATAFAVAAGEHFQQPFAIERARYLATLPDGDAKSRGVDWGAKVGRAVVRLRTGDGSHASRSNHDLSRYPRRGDALRWTPTGPHFDAGEGPAFRTFARGLLPGMGRTKPWGVRSLAPFRAPDFPDPRSREFAEQYEMVRQLGAAKSPQRTADQTQVALFWEDGPWGVTPPGHFCLVALELLGRANLSFTERARGLALVSMAMADAATATWDAKYHHDVLRPETAIRSRSRKLDPTLTPDRNWKSLIPTPPFPAYTSGHSAFGASATRALAHVLGTDAVRHSARATDTVIWPNALSGVTRSWGSLSAMAEENGMSRIYGGVHWLSDHTEGMRAGRSVADAVVANNLQAVGA